MKKMRFLIYLACLVGIACTDPADHSVIILGDIHYDKMEHHDFTWLESNKPDDIRQINDYTRITSEKLPLLVNTIRSVSEHAMPSVQNFIQAGDFTEGLCGSYSLAERQLKEFTAYIDSARLGIPFCVVQGNHDITRPGAKEAYAEIIDPWMVEQIGVSPENGCYTIAHEHTLFLFYNSYDDRSLDWLEQTIRQSDKDEYVVISHEPVVPFQARSNWIQFAGESEEDKRTRLLHVLGEAGAIVICAHLHDYGIVARVTEKGTFVQLALNSVLDGTESSPRDLILGLEHYDTSLVDLEPDFSPQTVDLRRQMLEAEKPFISHFEFADVTGFVRLVFSGGVVSADVYVGTDTSVWRSVNLSALKDKASKKSAEVKNQ